MILLSVTSISLEHPVLTYLELFQEWCDMNKMYGQ